jgi:hypothetical protein
VSGAAAALSMGLLGGLAGCLEQTQYQQEDCYVATPADGGAVAACLPSTSAGPALYSAAGFEPCGQILSVDEGPIDGGLTSSGASCCYLVTWKAGVCLGL